MLMSVLDHFTLISVRSAYSSA